MNRMRALGILVPCFCIVVAGPLRSTWAEDGKVLPLPTEDQQEIATHLGSDIVGQALPSLPITDPLVYFPLQERSAEFLVTSGKNTGKKHVLTVTKRNRAANRPAAWRAGISTTLAGFLQQTTTGDLLMSSVADSEHDVLVVTTPANPFLLKGMEPGETRSFTQAVAVNYLDDPTRQDYSGSLKGTYTYVGNYQVTVPAGTYPAILMRSKFAGKVGPAHTEDTAYYFFAPQTGVVAMISQEDVEAFWIIHIDTTSGKVLASK